MVTLEALTDAALAVLERDGLDALSMRKVAAELGVQAPSLYWHVRHKEELLDLVADALFRDVEPPPLEGDWRARTATLATAYRTFLIGRRDAVRLLGGRFVVGPHSARALELILSTLREAGFSAADAAHAMYLVMVVYVQGFVLQEMIPMSAAHALGASPEESMEIIADRIRALPADQFPYLVASQDLLTMLNLEDRFRFGLDRILDGLALHLS